jgi:DNA-binding MarR family transcriptional regulator
MDRLKRAVIKEELVALTGDFVKAVILNQFLYWSERVDDFDKFIVEERQSAQEIGDEINISLLQGWIYKKAEELAEETMLKLSKSNMMNHIKVLVESKWIEQRRNPRNKMDKTYQYRVNIVVIQKALLPMGYSLEGYRVPLSFIIETASESRSSDLKLRSSEIELGNHETEQGGSDSKLRGSDSSPRSSNTEQQYQRSLTKITPETTITHLASAYNETASAIESSIDVCDQINKLLGISINSKTLAAWRGYADDITIVEAASLAQRVPDIKNVIGYISAVLKNGFTPSINVRQDKSLEQRDERYGAFYQLFPDS